MGLNSEAVTIAVDQIVAAGREIGLKQNQLSELLGFKEGSRLVSMQASWKEVLPALVEPNKYAVILTGGKGSFARSVNYAVHQEKCVLFNEIDKGILRANFMSLREVEAYFAKFVQGEIIKREVELSMSFDALLTLCALADALYRRTLQALLDKYFRAALPTAKELKDRIADAIADGDQRWLTDFILAIYNAKPEVDVEEGLAQLVQRGVIALAGEEVEPTDSGWPFLADLADRNSIFGGQCYYYDGGQPVRSTTILLRTSDHIWLVDCSEESYVCGLDSKGAQTQSKKVLRPAEEPPISR